MVIYPVPKYRNTPQEAASEARTPLLADADKRALVSVMQAARLLGKSRDTVYRWLNEGRLAGRRVGGRWLVYRDTVEEAWRSGAVEQKLRGPHERS